MNIRCISFVVELFVICPQNVPVRDYAGHADANEGPV